MSQRCISGTAAQGGNKKSRAGNGLACSGTIIFNLANEAFKYAPSGGVWHRRLAGEPIAFGQDLVDLVDWFVAMARWRTSAQR